MCTCIYEMSDIYDEIEQLKYGVKYDKEQRGRSSSRLQGVTPGHNIWGVTLWCYPRKVIPYTTI